MGKGGIIKFFYKAYEKLKQEEKNKYWRDSLQQL